MADVNCNILIDEDTKSKLQVLADKEDRSLSSKIRLIIDEYLSNKK